MVSGFPLTGDPQQATDDLRKRVLANQPIGEHKRKPPVISQRLKSGLEPKVRHGSVWLIEPIAS
jgi:hypothetical protein